MNGTILNVGATGACPTFPRDVSETVLQQQAILYICEYFKHYLRLWRNNSGATKIDTRFISFGVRGQGDASGIIKPFGTRIEIEFKRPGKKQRQDQKDFQAMIKAHGGIYLLCDGDIQGQIIEPLENYLKERINNEN